MKMLSTRPALFAATILLCAAQTALAKPPTPTAATPIGSPAEWLKPNDYPAVALRFDMQGTTAFRLDVDKIGKPTRCAIVASSGFDVLDNAACGRLMANAQFTPARDHKGTAVPGVYSSRVRWVLPKGQAPVTERFASMVLSIEQTGKVTACKMVVHLPAQSDPSDKECEEALRLFPPYVGIEFRGNSQAASATVEVWMGDAFTPELRAQILAPKPGYDQRGLSVHRFTVTNDGKLGDCLYVEQRGSAHVADNFCQDARKEHFDPPFSAFGKDGVANGSHIMRVLLKSGGQAE